MITAQKITTTKPIALVAGGAGFIGSFLCEALLLQDCRVICVDNLSKGNKENLKKCLGNPNFTFLEYDLTKPLPAELKGEGLSYIFDLVGLEAVSQNLWQLASKTRARFLIVSSGNFRPEIFKENFLKGDVRIVNLVDVYGPRMPVGKIPEPKSLFITDAIFGIIKAMFAPGTAGKIFYLTSEGEEKLKWKPQVSFEKGIQQISKTSQTKKYSITAKRRNFKLLIFLPIIFLFIILTPFFWGGLNGFLGIRYFKQAQKFFLSGDFKKAAVGAKKAEIFFRKAEKMGKPFRLGGELARGLAQASLAADSAAALSGYIFQNTGGDVQKLISEIKIGLDQSYFYLSLIEGELKNPSLINQTANFFWFKDQLNELNQKIPKIKNLIIQAKKVIEILPWLIGQDQKRTYLVLLQNNNELRPTGGFIGSFAILTFNQGKLVDFEVQDVYWADGQLKGHVEPPLELKKYLGEANWYLRDSNWDPDFPTSAVKAQWFLEKETGRVVDGVVGINLFVAQRLLRAVGEIELPDYKEKINANNFFERAQYYSEIGFFPGSTQKQDFLGATARILFEKIKNAKGKTQGEIAKALYESLKSKDILVYLNDSSAMEKIFDLGWDGAVRNVKCQISDSECLADYLAIIEANVGVNKANYFVEREINQEIQIGEDGRIEKVLKIFYRNTSPSAHFPAGDYKNYLRILVPKGSELERILIGKEEVGKEKIDIKETAGKTSFGFLINIPVGEERKVEISWLLPEKIPRGRKTQYLYLVQKQSGTKQEKFSLKISPPPGTVIIPAWPPATFQDNSYLFNPNFSSDLPFEMYFVGE
ncbi:MAG: DUF4012 domain-containing protein [Microgenomates group bacterium]